MTRGEKVWRVAGFLRTPVENVMYHPSFLDAILTEEDQKRLKSVRRRMERLVDLLTDDELQSLHDRFFPVETDR